jgi:hypothetical protein
MLILSFDDYDEKKGLTEKNKCKMKILENTVMNMLHFRDRNKLLGYLP